MRVYKKVAQYVVAAKGVWICLGIIIIVSLLDFTLVKNRMRHEGVVKFVVLDDNIGNAKIGDTLSLTQSGDTTILNICNPPCKSSPTFVLTDR